MLQGLYVAIHEIKDQKSLDSPEDLILKLSDSKEE
jgi:hypothetical protein